MTTLQQLIDYLENLKQQHSPHTRMYIASHYGQDDGGAKPLALDSSIQNKPEYGIVLMPKDPRG